jgi:hypothetical protein
MNQRAKLEAAETSIAWPFEPVRKRASTLWARILQSFTARWERWAAAILYAELSKLSDAELKHRGIARGDLHRQVFETEPHTCAGKRQSR